jgi:hypothetical protein
METINEVLNGVAYFSLNPIAWAAAISISIRSRKLRSPVIAAVMTQTLISGLLISLSALSDKAFPINDLLVLVLLPGVLSGMLISALVILCSKRRRLIRMMSSGRTNRLAYK